jgi:hypothetical protein
VTTRIPDSNGRPAWTWALALAGAGLLSTGSASAGEPATLGSALADTKLILDARLRAENVEQEGVADEAHAVTLRARLGFETGKVWNTTFLAEGEGIVPLRDDYRPDNAQAVRANYPVVADPEAYEMNRLQLTNTSLPGTTITLGRQRINLDDQRFVGGSAWRQDEQTFDALRIVNKSVKNLTLDAAYLNQVNRVNGPDSPQGRYHGDSVLLNAGYQTRAGKITAFGYLLDFENIATVPAAVRDSTSTIGLRFAGEQAVGAVKLAYSASYATQKDYADNPLSFDLDYRAAEAGATWKQLNVAIGTERFEGNGAKGFTTPLGTLHKFNGWADKFLATPPNGLDDDYVTVGTTFKNVIGLDSLAAVAGFHDYAAARISADYGDEWDLSLAAKLSSATLLLKYADFDQGVLASARTTRKLWAQLEFVW